MKIPKPLVVATEKALSKALHTALKGRRYVLLTDEQVTEVCLPQLADFMVENPPLDLVEVDRGEEAKSGEVVMHLWTHLLELGVNRNDVLLCLGGGSICDVGGFVAATYKRGISVVFVPTTLLAMTDAAIGGKNGIDVDGVKNAVGTIRMPERIIVYPGFCETLPETEFYSGYAEVIKHAVLAGEPLFSMVQTHLHADRRLPTALLRASMAVKHRFVQADPWDEGERLKLNLGHTVGHALEAAALSNGRPIPHGIAVALGMQVEFRLARLLEVMSVEEEERLRVLIASIYARFTPELPDWEEVEPFLLKDKKRAMDGLRIPIVSRPGCCEVISLQEPNLVQLSYNQLFKSEG